MSEPDRSASVNPPRRTAHARMAGMSAAPTERFGSLPVSLSHDRRSPRARRELNSPSVKTCTSDLDAATSRSGVSGPGASRTAPLVMPQNPAVSAESFGRVNSHPAWLPQRAHEAMDHSYPGNHESWAVGGSAARRNASRHAADRVSVWWMAPCGLTYLQ